MENMNTKKFRIFSSEVPDNIRFMYKIRTLENESSDNSMLAAIVGDSANPNISAQNELTTFQLTQKIRQHFHYLRNNNFDTWKTTQK